MENLTGGSGADAFTIAAGADLTGGLADGGGGTDSYDVSAIGGNGVFTLGINFSNTESITGAATQTIAGDDTNNTINLGATNTLDGATFIGFGTVAGGAGNDEFNVVQAKTVDLAGGSGDDTFNIDAA